MRYTVLLLPDSETGVFVAYVPALGVTTQGTSVEDALAMAKEASELVIEDMAERGEDVPLEEAGAVVSSIDVELPVFA
jgi:predicted RNase H-like HicB family nuclease